MHLLIIASLLIPTVLGGCCFPHQLFGVAYSTNLGVGYKIAMDFTASKYVLLSRNSSVSGFQLFDFSAGKQYSMGSDGNCKITSLNSANGIKPCIPSNAKTLGTSFLGNPNLMVTSYQYKVGDRKTTIAVSNNQCYPVISVTQQTGQAVAQTTVFADLVESDPMATQMLNPDTSNCVADDGTIG